MKTWGMVLLVFILMTLACGFFTPPTPTPILPPTLPASPTVLPMISPQPSDVSLGRSNPTSAALAAEGDPAELSPITPPPTEASIPITVISSGGIRLQADLYGATIAPAPALLLVHGEDGSTEGLRLLSRSLQAGGYHVMVIALRGYGGSSGQADWSRAPNDVQAALETLRTLPSVTAALGVITEGRAAAAGWLACQTQSVCQAVMWINPLPDPLHPPLDTLIDSTIRPLWSMASQDAPQSLALVDRLAARLSGISRVEQIDYTQLTVIDPIMAWLNDQFNG